MYSIRMINTYNENSLHKSLKNFYAYKYDGELEVKIDKYICDIVCKNDLIIEIQTSNLSKLTTKLESLTKNYKVLLIYPLATKTFIKTYSPDGILKSHRKSPKTNAIYSIFGELFTLYKLFNNKNFTLSVIKTTQTKEKHITQQAVQTINKSRRFRKNYLMTNKFLTSIDNEIIFSNFNDLANLLPQNLPEIFSSKELSQSIVGKDANKMLWVLHKAEIIELIEVRNKRKYYKIKKEYKKNPQSLL